MKRHAVVWRSALAALTITWGTALAAVPGDPPRYFSHPNYANSPLPDVTYTVTSVGNPLQDRAYASDFPVAAGEVAPVLVVLQNAPLPTGMVQSFQVWNQATASPFPSAGNVLHAYVLRPTGVPNHYFVLFDSGQLTVPALTTPGVSEVATFAVPNVAVQANDLLAFSGQGVPVDTGTGSDILVYPTTAPPVQGTTIFLGAGDYPILEQTRTYSFAAQVLDMTPQTTTIAGGIRKFVDGLPLLDAAGANNLGQYISVAVPDKDTYDGSDYYEIAVVEFTKQMHRDLPATRLRGYVQLSTSVVPGAQIPLFEPDGVTTIKLPNGQDALAVAPPQYLGATIQAQKDRPVRVLFRNLLPTGEAGNLFIPVDTTVMGSGLTAHGHMMEEMDPQKPRCSEPNKYDLVVSGECYAENRATLHLHGGISPWISDGTPHQWITPAGEDTPYPKGVSVIPVPDMPDPGPGAMTFFYTNQQSARLMFYHDHAWGITRLNVYAGEAAGYLLRDETEQSLIGLGLIPVDEIPLIVQDKTFVPGTAQLLLSDETWDVTRWGGEGNLWMPHVYVPAQNPGSASGVNDYGRWAYGPWFWPPTTNIENGPMDNPYFDPNCDPDVADFCEPDLMPGVPYLSMGMESFQDTPIVNGTAYPTLTIEPKAYRFRVLNAANDRFFNLSLFKAVDANGVVCDANNPNPAPQVTGELEVACTEVALNPQELADALLDPFVVFPTPVPGNEGPDWIQIGTEGGFLPAPVVIPAHPTTWVNDPTVFNAGNVDQHSLLLGPAERADVIVDFSQYAGQTLILYNDAPAAFPARDPRYDYYTGNADLVDAGGTPSTLPGYGPNTRTVMQIKVIGTPAAAFDLGALELAFAHQADGSGVFESGQNPIIVGQGAYNSAYDTSFTGGDGLVQIYDTALDFETILGDQLTMSLRPKMIQDEMGEAFEHEYGRMSGFLGVETPNAQAGLQNMILYPFLSPPTEVIDGVEVLSTTTVEGNPSLIVDPITDPNDGSQIWKITHNGVDTHPIHFHLYEVQLLNRVGWDGIIRKPDLNELGWKDTVRVSPLEDTIVALRPIIPHLPWDLPNSVRLIDPSMMEGEYIANTTLQETLGLPIFAFNPDGEPIDIINHYVNFGAEYVWHCHILSHEEMDMMHAQAVAIAPRAPITAPATLTGSGNNKRYVVTWTDKSTNETGFVVQRRVAGSTGDWTHLATVPTGNANFGEWPFNVDNEGPKIDATGTYVDRIGNTQTQYEYQVLAVNTVGDVWDYSNPAFNEIPAGGGFPRVTVTSTGETIGTPGMPTIDTASAAVKNGKTAIVTLTWTPGPGGGQTGFLIQRADDAGFNLNVVNATVGDVTTFTQAVPRHRTFHYRVLAFNDFHQSGWSDPVSVDTP
jgi:FtsP/CotA-like multicopper oxidase with cupredoxin domain